MDIYRNDGYLDMRQIIESGAQLIVIVGSRRIGKTFGAFDYYTTPFFDGTENPKPFVYARLKDSQLQLAAMPINNPWKPLNRDKDYNVAFEKIGSQYLAREVLETDEQGKPITYGRIIAQGRSIYDTRGLSSGDYCAVILDEFIPERGSIERKHAGYNLKSTIQSLSDKNSDIKIILLANANNLDNDILSEFGLIEPLEEMSMNKEECRFIQNGAILLINAYNSPVSEEMAKTPLGRILNTGEYGEMAYSNKFATTDLTNIKKGVNLREYKPFLKIGDLLIYRHKGQNLYYITQHKGGTKVPVLPISNRIYFEIVANYPSLKLHASDGKIIYNSFDTKRKFFKLIKEKTEK